MFNSYIMLNEYPYPIIQVSQTSIVGNISCTPISYTLTDPIYLQAGSQLDISF